MQKVFMSLLFTILITSGCFTQQASYYTVKPNYTVKSKPIYENLSYLGLNNNNQEGKDPDWKVLIYLNVGANLVCYENMDAWRELAPMAKKNNGTVGVWTNANDSTDVDIALKLERINLPINVADSTMLKQLKWDKLASHFKIVFSKENKILNTRNDIDNNPNINSETKEFLKALLYITVHPR